MTLSASVRKMKEERDFYWEREDTHTHRGGSNCPYLVISDVLVLSCFYLYCSLISMKHSLTNLFDKSTLGINCLYKRTKEEERAKDRGRSTERQQIEGKKEHKMRMSKPDEQERNDVGDKTEDF